MPWRHALVLVVLSSTVVACGALIGIQDIGVDPAAPAHDGGAPVDAEPPADASVPDSADVSDSALPPPPMLDASTPTRRVFLLSTPTTGNIGGLAGADTLCRAAATPLGGRWVAFVSGEGMRAVDRLDFRGPYVTLTKPPVPVLLDKNDLPKMPALEHLINIMEDGTQLMSDHPWVWTGTDRAGNGTYNCNNWTNGTSGAAGIAGSFDQASNNKWVQNDGEAPFVAAFDCGTPARLYCFELN